MISSLAHVIYPFLHFFFYHYLIIVTVGLGFVYFSDIGASSAIELILGPVYNMD